MDKKKNNYSAPALSILYVYFNTPEEIRQSIASLRLAARYVRYEIIIVDNNSHIPIPKDILRLKSVTYIKSKKNIGYGAGLNLGEKKAKGEYLLVTNTDTIYKKNTIRALLSKLASDKTIGVIGPKMLDEKKRRLLTSSKLPLFPRNVVLYSFLRNIFPFSYVERNFHYKDVSIKERTVGAIGGACMLFRRTVFKRVGGFDQRFFLYFEESDICKKITDIGLKVVYYPRAIITHLVGRSLGDKEKIQVYFEKSRFLFIQKHQSTLFAFLSEALIRSLRIIPLFLLSIFFLSLFINLYQITSLMMFFGDFGRDMLVARDMVTGGNIPLLGIPSSVVWLSQGPLSIYLIGMSFLVGGFSAYVPGVMYAVLGSVTTLLVYKLGSSMFNKHVGILSAIFFACSPLVIINSRIPYHHAPIPFFAAVFFIGLFSYIKRQTKLSLIMTGLFLGFLFQLELSNGVLFFLIVLLFYIHKIPITRNKILTFLASFSFGILPFIIYDLTHMFTQTIGFAAWVINRIRLFFGLTISGNSTTSHAPEAMSVIWENLVRFVYPESAVIATSVIVISLLYLVTRVFSKKNIRSSEMFLCLSLTVPFLGFIVHARPGMAYFPLVFPILALLFGYVFYALLKRTKIAFVLFIAIALSNCTFVLSHQYFMDVDGQKGSEISYWNYGLGVSLQEQKKVVVYLKNVSQKEPIKIVAGGFLTEFKTSIDNYHYLAWESGVVTSIDGKQYVIYQDKNDIPKTETIVFQTNQVYLTTR